MHILTFLICFCIASFYGVCRWNPNLQGQIAIGCKNSAVFLFSEKTKAQKLLHVSDRHSPVVDLQWDRLSSAYLLVAYQFFLSLWDAESGSEIHTFEKQTVPITCVAWLDWTAGNFISANGRNCNLKVWNASQKQPLDTLKFTGATGINNMTFCPGKKRVLCGADDGSVCVLNIQNRQMEFQSSAGHKETIFDCKMSPTSPNIFCTASYDSTVKVWSVGDLKLSTTLHGNSGDVIYCCDWSPKGSMIAASSFSGLLTVWDVETGRELGRYLHHTKASYCVAWNKHSENLIATTSADGTLAIIHVNFETLYDPHKAYHTGSRKQSADSHRTQLTRSDITFRHVHPAAVYGCSWSITHASIIATACHDGIVRVFNHVMKEQLIYQLVGHSQRVFGVSWSPLLPGYLATSSDDNSVMVWEVNLDRSLAVLSKSDSSAETLSPAKRLLGHTQYARALAWNYEHRNLLLSGSWDASIRLWDALSGSCLLVINDHIADVYAIASHPERPFTYISCSRDTTVRVWEMEGVSTLIRYNAVWDGCFDRISDRSRFGKDKPAARSFKKLLSDLPATLHGNFSCNLNATLSHISHKTDEQRQKSRADSGKHDEKSGEFEADKFERILPSDPLNLAANFYKIYTFFNGASGSMDVWENALSILGEQRASILQHKESFKPLSMTQQLRPSSMRQICNEHEVLDIARSEARKLESAKMNARKSDMSSKVEDQLRSAAMIHARAGDFLNYCSIMVDLGDWTAALAMAPSVSTEYWKSLCNRYSQHLITEASEQCIPYLLATGKDADAVEFYLRRHDPNNAMVVAKMSEQRVDLIPDYVVTLAANANEAAEKEGRNVPKLGKSSTFGTGAPLHSLSLSNIDEFMWTDTVNTPSHHTDGPPSCVRERTVKEMDDSRLIVRVVSSHSAKVHLDSARPMLAAAQFLSVEDVPGAISILSNNFEHDMAYALAQCFNLDTSPHIIDMADRCASFGAVELAVEMLRTLPNGEEEVGLMLSRYCDEGTASDLVKRCHMRTMSAWATRANEEEQIGSDAESVTSYVISHQYVRAVRVGVDVLKRVVRDPLELSPASKKLLRALKYIKASELDESLRAQFLLYILWFTAHEAAMLGLWDTACNMLSILHLTCGMGSFALTPTDIQFQIMFFRICAGKKDAIQLIDQLVAAYSNSGSADTIQDLRHLSDLLKSAPPSNTQENSFLVSSAFKYKSSPIRMAEGVWGDHTHAIMKYVSHELFSSITNPYVMER